MLRIVALMFFLLSLPAGAETIIVRSGDHAGFSRLVFPFSNPVNWKLGRVGKGYELRFHKTEMTFELDKVFQKISHERIRSLGFRRGNSYTAITIELNCECHADAFEFRPGLLVVDIKDGPPEKSTAFEQAFSGDETVFLDAPHAPAPETQMNEFEIPQDASSSGEISQQRMDPAKLPLTPSYEKAAKPFSLPLLVKPEQRTPEVLFPVSKPQEIREMGKDFLSAIAKAASDGLLTPNVRVPYPEPADKENYPVDTKPSMGNGKVDEPSDEMPKRGLPIRVRSSIDDAAPAGNDRQFQLNADGAACLPESVFDLPAWGNPSAPYETVVLARANLVGEFDQVMPEDITTLMRAYLYAGFGAEVKNIYSAFDKEPENPAILMAMAEIMDDGWAFERSVLTKQINCQTPGALWAALSLPEFPRGLEMNRHAIQQAFTALPAHIRRQLGPSLVNRFLDAGDEEMAHVLKSTILRVADPEDSRIVLMEANFPQDGNAMRRTEQKLEDIIRTDQVMSAKALRKLLETRLEHGEEISDRLLQISVATAYEREGTEMGKALLGLNAQALASRGKFSSALREWQRYSQLSNTSDKEASELLERLLDFATKTESNREFLTFVFGAKKYLLRVEAAGQAFEAAAERLIDLGFPELGNTFLEKMKVDERQQYMLKARAAMAMGQPELAMDLLKDMRNKDALLLKAKAAEALSNFALAASLYHEAENQSAFQRMLMKMNQWDRLKVIGSGVMRNIAEIAVEDLNPIAEDDGRSKMENLSLYRQLVGNSENTRIALERLLKAISVQMNL